MQFNNCELSVNSFKILADSLSVSQNSDVKPASVINLSSPVDYIPSNLNGNISIDYYIEPQNEPNYSVITGWKANTTGNTLCVIKIGTINISGYLNSYSLSVSPHEPIKARANYVFFNQITGNWESNISTGTASLYNLTNSSGLAHYWSTFLCSGNNILENNGIIDLSYTMNFEIFPTYGIANKFPKQVNVLVANEELTVSNETQINLDFQNNNNSDIFPIYDTIKIKTLSSNWVADNYEVLIPTSGMKIISNNAAISVNNIMLYNTRLVKYY